jgi:heavy metal sensor kinase
LWYSAAVFGALAVYAAVVFAVFEHNLWRQLDALLHEDAEHVGTEVLAGGVNPLSEEDEWAEVWSADRRVYQSPAAASLTIPLAAPPRGSQSPVSVRLADGSYFRVVDERQRIEGRDAIVRVAEPEKEIRQEVSRLLLIMGAGVPLAALLAAFGGYQLARAALSPMNVMAERAQAIGADRLHERLPVLNADDEIGRLARVVNDLLARLERSFAQMQRFTSDASHELRTPLTAIRTVGEVALRGDASEAAYRETIESMLEEVARLTHLVDAMLLLSRADAGRIPVNRADTNLVDLAEEVAQHLGVIAEENEQAIRVAAPGPVIVRADPVLLRMAIVNLLDNALRYSPAHTRVDITVTALPRAAGIAVADQGPGITPEDQQRLFERFFRVDEARARTSGGAGLGLSIARWAVEAHGGRLEVTSRPGDGSVFRITLPR